MVCILRPTGIPQLAVAFFVTSLLCLSCSDQGAVQPNSPDYYELSDEEILDLVYSSYIYPPGFYYEELWGGTPYYENTVSILPLDDRPSSWIQLCTIDRDLAFAWSESSATHGAQYLTLVAERQTEKYFQFRRVWLDDPHHAILSRVHKCSYLDRSMYDHFRTSRILGVFNQQPRTAAGTTELIEYMWSAGLVRGAGKVFYSDLSESPEAFLQTILSATKVGGDWGICDEIYLKEARFTVKKRSGEITVEVDTLRIIRGRCQ